MLAICLFFTPFPGTAVFHQKASLVVLTAEYVDGANDIEAAIEQATARGTRYGTVILDGSEGAFTFTDLDKSINIYVSSLTLRGTNQAVIKNCDDGLFFDALSNPPKNILVEGIAFLCAGDGVEAGGAFQNVTLRNDMFKAGNNGITIAGASSGWLISGNVIEAEADGIVANGAKNMVISNNHVSGFNGISLPRCAQFQVRQNAIQAKHQGVLLSQEAWKNMVQANTIIGVSQAGIALEPGVTGNRVLGNRVLCAPGANCSTTRAGPGAMEMNTITGNQP
jgi:nitrous oxidase accessory protein NosD